MNGSVDARQDGDSGVVVLELQRADRRNALNTVMVEAIRGAAEQAVADGARVLVITGQGSAFCAGADLSGDVYQGDFPEKLIGMLDAIEALPVPVVAALNGPAIGAGVQLALACDLRVVSESARIEVPVVKVGVAVHTWTMRRLAEVLGGRARNIMFAGEPMHAPELLERGFGNRAGGLTEAVAWARELAKLAPLSLRHVKMAFNENGARDPDSPELHAALEAAWQSEDKDEARLARSERRPPEFTGR
ncbi:enoyl-CoA hydratase [Tomitella biformata]|uniref:enoyl-CoA hydratase n=1 Tax=Tomitella biformata TaxID=630403 RepID=UPI0004B4ADC3|nr:enoyl-CoA hydratase [Tomitella biformata]